MPALTFSKWSPGGNTTLLFPDAGQRPAEQARLASLALDSSMLGGEQAGFVNLSQHKLRMAGGEFCVNASRAVGALLAYTAQYSGPEQGVLDGIAPRSEQKTEAAAPAEHPVRLDEIQVSGWQTPVRLRTRGSAPLWQVEALLRLPEYSITTIEKGAHLVRLPGICHLLLGGATHPLPDDCHAVAAQLRQQHGLEAGNVRACWICCPLCMCAMPEQHFLRMPAVPVPWPWPCALRAQARAALSPSCSPAARPWTCGCLLKVALIWLA